MTKSEYGKEYYLANKEKIKAKSNNYYHNNIEKAQAAQRAYREVNKEKLNEYARVYKKNNPEKVKESKRKDRINNRDRINQDRRERLQKDPQFKIACRLRTRIWKVLNGTLKSKSSLELLGCSLQEFKVYIESKFTDGMSWERISEIHLDHMRPCSSFDLTDTRQQEQCFHYSNMQPLWALDNLSKNDKY
jgi:hypothetical protein